MLKRRLRMGGEAVLKASRRFMSGRKFLRTVPVLLGIGLFYLANILLEGDMPAASYLALGLLLMAGGAFGLETASVLVLAMLVGGEATRWFGGYASLGEVIPMGAALLMCAVAVPVIARARLAKMHQDQQRWTQSVADVRMRVGQRVGELAMATPLPPEMEPATSPEALAHAMLVPIKRSLKCRTVAFYWYHDTTDALVPICALSDLDSELYAGTIPMSRTSLRMAKRAQGLFPVPISDNDPHAVPLYTGSTRVEKVAVVPVRFQDKLAGIFLMERTSDAPWAGETEVASSAARLVGDALVTEQRLRSSMRVARHFQEAIEAVHELTMAKGFESIYETIVRYATRLAPFSHCVLAHRLDASGREFEISCVSSRDMVFLTGKRFTLQGNLCAVAAKSAVALPDKFTFRGGMPQPFGQGIGLYLDPGETCVLMPLRAQGQVLGFMLMVDNKGGQEVKKRVLTKEEMVPLYLFADYCAQTLANAESNQALERLAISDGVTGLPNQRAFLGRLKEAVSRADRTKKPMSLLFCDLDHFKEVNDTFGHQIGDTVLRAVAGTFQGSLRTVDFVGRYGGEEFVAILEEAGPDGAMTLAERVRKSVENLSFQDCMGRKKVTVSIGIATYGVDSQDAEHLIALADAAMYAAKKAGRNQCKHAGLAAFQDQPANR